MIMQVHDELVLEVAKKDLEAVTKALCKRMSAAAELAARMIRDIR